MWPAGRLKPLGSHILAQQGDYTGGLGWVTVALPPQTYFTAIAMERQQIDVQGETDSAFSAVSYALTRQLRQKALK